MATICCCPPDRAVPGVWRRPLRIGKKPFDDRGQRMQDLRDPDDRHALHMEAPDRRDQGPAFAFGQASRDFIEKQEFRPRGHGADEIQPLAVEQRERAGQLVRPFEKFGVVQDRDTVVLKLDFAPALTESGGSQEILERGEAVEGLRDLEAAADTHADADHRGHPRHIAPEEGHGPEIGQDIARDQVEWRGFPRAVRADDAQRLTLRHRKADVVGHLQGAEAFRDIGEGQGAGHAIWALGATAGEGGRAVDQASASIVPPVGMAGGARAQGRWPRRISEACVW